MKTNFTQTNFLVRLLSVVLFSSLCTVDVSAQSCACKQNVQVSLGSDGTATVTASMLLADNVTCGGTGTVTVMLTPTGSPIAGSPNVNCTHAGKTLYGKVTNGVNSCWSTLLIEDKVKPVITCPTGPITKTCTEMATYSPVVYDACGVLDTVILSENITVNNCNNGMSPDILKRIVRVYQSTDVNGNKSDPCTITIDVTRIPDLNAIAMPSHYLVSNNTSLECDGPWAKLANGNPSPVNIGAAIGTGVPKLGSIALFPDPNLYCNLMVSYTDTKLPRIGCVTKIMRSWQVIEWSCDNRTRAPYVQMIEIVDSEGPIIPVLANIQASTGNHDCSAVISLVSPLVTDNCSPTSSLTIDITIYLNSGVTPGPFIKHGNPKVATLPVGTHLAVYTAYDECYNSSTKTIVINVEDNTAPVAICDEFTTVGLTSDGTAFVPATVFDDGSYDECELGKVLVRRMNNSNCPTCETPSFPGFKFLGSIGTGNNTRYYYLSNHKAAPKTALKTAKAMGGFGVSYETSAERTAVRNLVAVVSDTLDFLVGYTDVSLEGTFKWESGATNVMSVVGNTANNQYVIVENDAILGVNNGQLRAVAANEEYRYVVEITDPCGWSAYAKFCCSDIGTDQMVSFRAIDKSGNFNDCMVRAVIQDKIGPQITCPSDRTVDCDFAYDPTNLRKDFGWPVATDNCESPVISQDSLISITSCRTGSIRRTFTVTDRGGRTASCTQVITFSSSVAQTYNGPLASQWPRDTMIVGCGDPTAPGFLPAALGSPILTDGACSLVGAQYIDQTYSFNNPSSPACFKILRTWTVIDWCQTVQRLDGSMGPKEWKHVQEIKVIDNIAPVFGALSPTTSVETFDPTCSNGNITLTANATDVCTVVLKNSYKIDINNDGSFLAPVNGTGNVITATGSYPVGQHKIVYSFEDKCGNVSTKEQLFSIINKKAPNAYVKNGLAMSLTANSNAGPSAEIWATDFDNGSSHPCGYKIFLSFTPITLNAGMMVGTPNLVFDCDDVKRNNLIIYVGALTPAGSLVQTSIGTFIDIQDNSDLCDEGRLAVNGTLKTETNDKVQNVNVSLIGSEFNMMTGNDGKFEFGNMPSGGNYVVTPERNDDFVNGVSTIDLVMIHRHILSLEKFNSPYKLIASDINKDGKISASDLVELRKLILGTTTSFSNNKSWRFVDKAYTFQDASFAQGEAFPETYSINNLTSNMVTDFVAIKVGDVNGNVKSNNFNNLVEARSINKLVLSTENTSFTKGEKVVIPIQLDRAASMSGMQFTLNFDANILSLEGIKAVGLNVTESNFGFVSANDGKLTVSWNDNKEVSLNEGTTLFNLSFIAASNGSTGNLFHIGSEITKAEAYNGNAEIMDVSWKVSERNESTTFALYQNTPNPFKEVTLVGYDLPKDMDATLTVYDVTGKVIRTSILKGIKGYNTVEINKNQINAGIMYYTLRAGEFTATKKMVVID
jgi:hypothetical protein